MRLYHNQVDNLLFLTLGDRALNKNYPALVIKGSVLKRGMFNIYEHASGIEFQDSVFQDFHGRSNTMFIFFHIIHGSIRNCRFFNNTVNYLLDISNLAIRFDNCTFEKNDIKTDMIAMEVSAQVTFYMCTFSKNKCSSAIVSSTFLQLANYTGFVNFEKSIITENTVYEIAHGYITTMIIDHSLFARNTIEWDFFNCDCGFFHAISTQIIDNIIPGLFQINYSEGIYLLEFFVFV